MTHTDAGPSRAAIDETARGLAEHLRAYGRRRSPTAPLDRRLLVLELLHTKPQLLVETVLVLTESSDVRQE